MEVPAPCASPPIRSADCRRTVRDGDLRDEHLPITVGMLLKKVRDNFARYGLLDDHRVHRGVLREYPLPGLGAGPTGGTLISDCIPTRFGEPSPSIAGGRNASISIRTRPAVFPALLAARIHRGGRTRQPERERLAQRSLPGRARYVGMDMAPGNGIDLVVTPGEPFPIADDSVDVAVTSSAFEHDACFWETFLDLMRVLKPGGSSTSTPPATTPFTATRSIAGGSIPTRGTP